MDSVFVVKKMDIESIMDMGQSFKQINYLISYFVNIFNTAGLKAIIIFLYHENLVLYQLNRMKLLRCKVLSPKNRINRFADVEVFIRNMCIFGSR